MSKQDKTIAVRLNERYELYANEAERRGLNISEFLILGGDKLLPKEVRDTLPARKKRGRPKKSED